MADLSTLGWNVNTEALPDNKDFSPLPLGDYEVMITNSKLMPTNDTKELMKSAGASDYETFLKSNPKASGYLALEMDVQNGTYAGRKLFHNLNLINDNAQTVEIAAGQLKQILSSLGMKTFSGKSEELHNKRLGIKVTVKEGKPYQKNGQTVQGQPQNAIQKFYALGAGATTAQAQTTAASGGQKAPWARG